MSSTVASRLLEVIEKTTAKHRRNKQLSELTGIDSERWSAFSLGRQRPTAEMLEGISRAFPSLCLWLMTGRDDKANAQYDVDTYAALKTHNLSELLKKEPIDLTEDEMRVISVEDERMKAASSTENRRMDYSDFLMIYEARASKLSRQQVLEKWHSEQQKLLASAYEEHQKSNGH